MFWRRKTLPVDDEPLVPHGLIWQATEDTKSPELQPDTRDHSPTEVEHSPAESVEMPARVSAPEIHRPPSAIARNSDELSPPLQWARVDDSEVARRAQLVDAAVSFPYRKPLVGAAVPKPMERASAVDPASEQEQQEPARLELVSISPLVRPGAVRWGLLSNLFSRFRHLKLADVSSILRRIGAATVFTRMEDGANRGVQSAAQGLTVLREKSGHALEAGKRGWVNGSTAVLSKSRAGVQRLRENARAIDNTGPAKIWRRACALRVTIRIPASNRRFLTSLVESAKTSGAQLHRSLKRDSQLWTSVAMAGISALLALGVISAMRHYGSETGLLPTTQKTVDAAAPSPAIQGPSQPVVSREAAGKKPSPMADRSGTDELVITRPAPAKARRKTSPSTASKKPRRHRETEEDDYVAADTYVFYGSGGKPKR